MLSSLLAQLTPNAKDILLQKRFGGVRAATASHERSERRIPRHFAGGG
jgi:hypothetical protein